MEIIVITNKIIFRSVFQQNRSFYIRIKLIFKHYDTVHINEHAIFP